MNFKEYIKEKHPEYLDEKVNPWVAAGLMGLAGLGVGKYFNSSPATHAPAPTGISQHIDSNQMRFNFGGPRKATATINATDDQGSGEVKFLMLKAFGPGKDREINAGLADKYITQAIFKAAGINHGKIMGLQKGISFDGNWCTATFSWDSIE